MPAGAREGYRVAPGRQRQPSEQVILGDVGLGEVRVDAPRPAGVGPRLVLEPRRTGQRLPVQQHVVGAVVGAVRHLRHQLVPPGLGDVERDVNLRSRPLRLEEEEVLRPEDLLLNRHGAPLRPDVGDGVLDLDLPRIAVRQARRAVRYRRLVARDAVLVPERHAAEQIGPLLRRRPHRAVGVVRPAHVLEIETQRPRERDRVGDVPAVRRHPRAEVGSLRNRHPGIRALRHPQAPGIVEVVLGARALDPRGLLAVHVDPLVPLAEPARLVLDDAQHGADVVPASLRGEHLVGPAGPGRQRLPVARVEIGGAGRQRRELRPVHVVVQVRHPAAALVGDRDAARPRERHRPVAVAGAAARTVADQQRVDRALEAVAHRERVAERGVDTRFRAAVVVHAQPQQARPPVLVRRHRDPHVGDDAGSLQVGEHDRLARQRPLAVVVASGVGVVARRPPRAEVLQLGKAEWVDRRLSGSLGGDENRQQDEREHGGQSKRTGEHAVLRRRGLFPSTFSLLPFPFPLTLPSSRRRPRSASCRSPKTTRPTRGTAPHAPHPRTSRGASAPSCAPPRPPRRRGSGTPPRTPR